MSVELQVPAPLPHQLPADQSPASRKVLRWGRRAGKTRWAFKAGIVGHGPRAKWTREVNGVTVERWEGPKFRGVADGRDVVWIARDYKQANALWFEEIQRRFRGYEPYVSLNETDRRVEMGRGKFWIRSAENIDSVRGAGAALIGVIVDEAAWQDLESELKNVILPALLDNGGWLILISTTNAGTDGNPEQRIPSYFNLLCQQIQAKERSAEWEEFYATPFDNPKLDAAAIEELIAEYDADSLSLDQEIYARLVSSNAVLALSELDEHRHFLPRFEAPPHWPRFGFLDWGHGHPWSFGKYVADERGNAYKEETLTGHRQRPDEIARAIRARFPDVERWSYVGAGSDIRQRHQGRVPTHISVPTVEEELAAHGLYFQYIDDGPYSLAPRLNNFRRYVAWRGKGALDPVTQQPSDGIPLFRWMDTPGNRACFEQCRSILTDPKKPENPLRKDADPQTGRGGDDMFAETMNALASRPEEAERVSVLGEHAHPGFEGPMGRRRRRREPREELEPVVGGLTFAWESEDTGSADWRRFDV